VTQTRTEQSLQADTAAKPRGQDASRTSPARLLILVWAMAGGVTACHRSHAPVQAPPQAARPADRQVSSLGDDVPPPKEDEEPAPSREDDELADRAAADPLAFLKMCHEHYRSTVRDYRCTFQIRERESPAGELGPQQEIEVRFRENPYSVDMRWVKNPVRAKRVNYVAGRWQRGGRELAMIYPSGVVALLTPAGVKLDIHSPEVRESSRRPVDDFGFRRTLELIIANCGKAASDPAYDLRYIGEDKLDGRPSIVLRRLLPYTGPDGPYPDRMLRIYIDREWLVPTGCYAFADDQGRESIGTYVTTDIEMNVGLTDDDF